MDLKLDKFNVRDATLRSLLALANVLGVKEPTKEQQEEMQEISDALEARVQDEIDNAAKTVQTPVEEEHFVEAETSDVFLDADDSGEIARVIHKGVVFGRLCNEPVHFDHETGTGSYCIKQWAHLNAEHEDSEGRFRL